MPKKSRRMPTKSLCRCGLRSNVTRTRMPSKLPASCGLRSRCRKGGRCARSWMNSGRRLPVQNLNQLGGSEDRPCGRQVKWLSTRASEHCRRRPACKGGGPGKRDARFADGPRCITAACGERRSRDGFSGPGKLRDAWKSPKLVQPKFSRPDKEGQVHRIPSNEKFKVSCLLEQGVCRLRASC